MQKLGIACLLGALTFAPLFAQFMDPERTANPSTTTLNTVDDLFPEIVPDHSSGDTAIIDAAGATA